MSNLLLRDQKVWLDGYDLSASTHSLSLVDGVEAKDDTALGDTCRSYKGGLYTVKLGIDGYFDGSLNDPQLYGAIGVADKPISVGTDSIEGARAFTFTSMTATYTPGAKVGEILGFQVSAEGHKSPLVAGVIMANRTAIATAGAGPSQQLGAIAAGKKLYMALHVLAVNNVADNLVATIESDATGAFSGAQTQRGTFTGANAIGSQWVVINGPITDQYWRIKWPTVTGSAPAFAFVAVGGIF